MQKRSQLNVDMHPSLLTKVKSAARRKGLSISEYVSLLVSEKESDDDLKEKEIDSIKNF